MGGGAVKKKTIQSYRFVDKSLLLDFIARSSAAYDDTYRKNWQKWRNSSATD